MSVFITYFSYQEFFSEPAQRDDLIACIAKYDGYSVLHFLRQLNSHLLIWENGILGDDVKYQAFVYRLLPNILGEQLVFELQRSKTRRRAFFHTRQLLYLAKLAIQHCSFGSGHAFGTLGIEAGLIFLKVNDQLHIQKRAEIDLLSDDDQDYTILGELIAVNEFASTDAGDLVIRAYTMLFTLPSNASGKAFYLDLEEIFASETGIALRQYFVMCFVLITGTMKEFYKKVNSALTFGKDVWSQSDLPEDVINSFWMQVSISVTAAKNELSVDRGNSDVTLFRRWPLLEHLGTRFGFDSKFFLEKLWAGPFWTIFHSSSDAENKLPQFVGWLFEQYLNEVFAKSCGPYNAYHPQPKRADRSSAELTDGILICNDTLILLEYKAAMFTAQAKYSGDRELLRQEVEKKLVQNERGRSKGVLQLHEAIEYLNVADLKTAVNGVDLSGIKTIYPLLITLEPLGDGLLVSRVLNRRFQSIRSAFSSSKFEVKRLHCTGVATIEKIAGAFHSSSVADLLNDWDSSDIPLRGTWRMYFDPSKHSSGRSFNTATFNEIEASMLPLLKLRE